MFLMVCCVVACLLSSCRSSSIVRFWLFLFVLMDFCGAVRVSVLLMGRLVMVLIVSSCSGISFFFIFVLVVLRLMESV